MNFDFLQTIPQLNSLYQICNEAEMLAKISPSFSIASSRKAVESLVKTLYSIGVECPDSSQTLFDLLDDPRFVNFINDETIVNAIHIVRKAGNIALHSDANEMSRDDADTILEQLHFVVGESCIFLRYLDDYPLYSPIADGDQNKRASTEPPIEVSQALPSRQNPVVQHEADVVLSKEEISRFAPKLRNAHFEVKHGRDEAANKRLFIQASLREAGWPIAIKEDQSIPATASINMTLADGSTIDYVLYGKDNKPLGIADFTHSKQSPIQGRKFITHAAKLLEQKYGYKPVAYYGDEYHIFCIDQLGFPPRRVFGFHSIDELDLLKQRKLMRKGISNPNIDDSITNREYQKNAIKSICAAFESNRRKALVVMATGTGKTRVSISLVDVLLKAGWIKNVLFLADRTSLVRQAHKNFNKLLPQVTTSIYTGDSSDRDKNARIIFSTYQTMIKLINDDAREFGIGRFDLIVVDEAHRSLFKKFGSLFRYFDALMVGLTATPRCEENKSTYEVFELPDGEPDYAYELEEAIQDGYLVGFSVLDRTTEALRHGIRYEDLTDEQKRQIEDEFLPDESNASESLLDGTLITPDGNIINTGTIDVMISDLMESGLKINAGDQLGKTIIFSRSHREAEVIVERFNSLYGRLGMDYCKLIDSHVENNLSLIDAFGERDSLPQIVVSVDMLDTGIDVPDVLNLVFFKPLRSKIKFLQMIGRGTRLSPDIFGPGMDKQGFLVFDYFDNFRYFNTRDTWSTVRGSGASSAGASQSLLINKRRLSILRQLQTNGTSTPFEAEYKDKLRDYFLIETQSLNNDAVEVAQNIAFVSKYRDPQMWIAIDDTRSEEIQERILPLLPPEQGSAKVKSFDLLILAIEDEYKRYEEEGKDPAKIKHGFGSACGAITERMEELLKLKTIPQVMQKETLISSMIDGSYLLDDFSLEKAESVRENLRELMSFIADKREYHIIDLPDKLVTSSHNSGVEKQLSYADKVNSYLADDTNPILGKIRSLDELTQVEKDELRDVFTKRLGSAAEYSAWSNNAPLLPYVRKQIGISDEAISTKFGAFLNSDVLSSAQVSYLKQVIEYAVQNGDITAMQLQTEAPFCDIDIMACFGQKGLGYLKTVLDGLHRPVME